MCSSSKRRTWQLASDRVREQPLSSNPTNTLFVSSLSVRLDPLASIHSHPTTPPRTVKEPYHHLHWSSITMPSTPVTEVASTTLGELAHNVYLRLLPQTLVEFNPNFKSLFVEAPELAEFSTILIVVAVYLAVVFGFREYMKTREAIKPSVGVCVVSVHVAPFQSWLESFSFPPSKPCLPLHFCGCFIV